MAKSAKFTFFFIYMQFQCYVVVRTKVKVNFVKSFKITAQINPRGISTWMLISEICLY